MRSSSCLRGYATAPTYSASLSHTPTRAMRSVQWTRPYSSAAVAMTTSTAMRTGSVAVSATSSSSTSHVQTTSPAGAVAHAHFLLDNDTDLDWSLLTESHRKHGVWLNAPPQLPPSTDAAVTHWLSHFDAAAHDAHARNNGNGGGGSAPKDTSTDEWDVTTVAAQKVGASHFPVYYSAAQRVRMRRRHPLFSEVDAASLRSRTRLASQQSAALRATHAQHLDTPHADTAGEDAEDRVEGGESHGRPPHAARHAVEEKAATRLSPARTLNRVEANSGDRSHASTSADPHQRVHALAQVPDIHLVFLQLASSPFAEVDANPIAASADASVLSPPWAYIPMHTHPPFVTTGTRSLLPLSSLATNPSAPSQQTPSSSTSATMSTQTRTVALRAAVDKTMHFHCTVCGKPYRRQDSALSHVRARHATAHTDTTALVGAGPGPGELLAYEDVAVTLMPSSAAVTTSVAAAPSTPAQPAPQIRTTPATPASPLSQGRTQTTRAYTDVPVVTLPEDALVDDLLLTVWDPVALARDDLSHQPLPSATQTNAQTTTPTTPFVPAAALVTANVDRRAEMQAAAEAKEPARATPAGAAPGIKRRPAPPTTSFPAEKRSGLSGAVLSVRERRQRYPNPFGDSPNAQSVEVTQEPVNPFMTLDEEAAGWRAMLARTSIPSKTDAKETAAVTQTRGWHCPLCARAPSPPPVLRPFRLVDAVLDHVEHAHAGEGGLDALTAEDWRVLRRPSAAAETTSSASAHSTAPEKEQEEHDGVGTAGSGSADAHTTTAGAHVAGDSSSSSSWASSTSSSTTTPTRIETVHVHARAATNMVLIGTVRDIQHGFLGRDPALQYVVETHFAPAEVDASDAASPEGQETELIVVRCVGPHVPVALLHQQIRYGTLVYVTGTLKMNRHVDTTSRRLHAYPYVHVSPPLGLIKAL